MRFKDCGNRFRVVMTLEDGNRFYGILTLPTLSNNRTTDFTNSRRILFVDDGSLCRVGSVFTTPKKERFLAAFNGVNEYIRSDRKTFLAVRITDKMTWQRKTETFDPVSGIPTGEVFEDLGDIWVAFESDRETEDTLKISKNDFRIVTNAELVEGDVIGGKYTVQRVDKNLGVSVAYV